MKSIISITTVLLSMGAFAAPEIMECKLDNGELAKVFSCELKDKYAKQIALTQFPAIKNIKDDEVQENILESMMKAVKEFHKIEDADLRSGRISDPDDWEDSCVLMNDFNTVQCGRVTLRGDKFKSGRRYGLVEDQPNIHLGIEYCEKLDFAKKGLKVISKVERNENKSFYGEGQATITKKEATVKEK